MQPSSFSSLHLQLSVAVMHERRMVSDRFFLTSPAQPEMSIPLLYWLYQSRTHAIQSRALIESRDTMTSSYRIEVASRAIVELRKID